MEPIFQLVRPEPFKIKTITPITLIPKAERKKLIKNVGFNVFKIPANKVFIDLLTDSGTSAMSDAQWAALMLGDEAYASATSWFKLEEVIKDIFKYKYILPAHQGRGAEKVLFSQMICPGQTVPNNMHFSPDRITACGGKMMNLVIEEGKKTESDFPFKGNMNVERLELLIKGIGPQSIPFIEMTVTCNNNGGQPVSMANLIKIREISKIYGIPIILDAARIAENAYFIKRRESGFENKSIKDIIRQITSLSDGCVMSAKKDGLVNIGGFVGINDDFLYEKMQSITLMWEGYITYGGMAGRDLEALAVGLTEVIDENYLEYRINQAKILGESLRTEGVPVITPIGGHGVWIDAKQFCPHIAPEKYPGIALTTALYEVGGIRGCELGNLAFSKRDEKTGSIISLPEMDLVRLAIPRRVYTSKHMEFVSEVVKNIYKNRQKLQGYRVKKYATIKYRTLFLGELEPDLDE